MSEQRDVLAEIEKVLFKVNDEVKVFDEIVAKMKGTSSDNLEEALKVSIKHLRRHHTTISVLVNLNQIRHMHELKEKLEIKRRQLKFFMLQGFEQSKEIEDQLKVVSHRKSIKTYEIHQQQRTKLQSKDGLSADNVDPKYKEHSDTIEWLQMPDLSGKDIDSRNNMLVPTTIGSENSGDIKGQNQIVKHYLNKDSVDEDEIGEIAEQTTILKTVGFTDRGEDTSQTHQVKTVSQTSRKLWPNNAQSNFLGMRGSAGSPLAATKRKTANTQDEYDQCATVSASPIKKRTMEESSSSFSMGVISPNNLSDKLTVLDTNEAETEHDNEEDNESGHDDILPHRESSQTLQHDVCRGHIFVNSSQTPSTSPQQPQKAHKTNKDDTDEHGCNVVSELQSSSFFDETSMKQLLSSLGLPRTKEKIHIVSNWLSNQPSTEQPTSTLSSTPILSQAGHTLPPTAIVAAVARRKMLSSNKIYTPTQDEVAEIKRWLKIHRHVHLCHAAMKEAEVKALNGRYFTQLAIRAVHQGLRHHRDPEMHGVHPNAFQLTPDQNKKLDKILRECGTNFKAACNLMKQRHYIHGVSEPQAKYRWYKIPAQKRTEIMEAIKPTYLKVTVHLCRLFHENDPDIKMNKRRRSSELDFLECVGMVNVINSGGLKKRHSKQRIPILKSPSKKKPKDHGNSSKVCDEDSTSIHDGTKVSCNARTIESTFNLRKIEDEERNNRRNNWREMKSLGSSSSLGMGVISPNNLSDKLTVLDTNEGETDHDNEEDNESGHDDILPHRESSQTLQHDVCRGHIFVNSSQTPSTSPQQPQKAVEFLNTEVLLAKNANITSSVKISDPETSTAAKKVGKKRSRIKKASKKQNSSCSERETDNPEKQTMDHPNISSAGHTIPILSSKDKGAKVIHSRPSRKKWQPNDAEREEIKEVYEMPSIKTYFEAYEYLKQKYKGEEISKKKRFTRNAIAEVWHTLPRKHSLADRLSKQSDDLLATELRLLNGDASKVKGVQEIMMKKHHIKASPFQVYGKWSRHIRRKLTPKDQIKKIECSSKQTYEDGREQGVIESCLIQNVPLLKDKFCPCLRKLRSETAEKVSFKEHDLFYKLYSHIGCAKTADELKMDFAARLRVSEDSVKVHVLHPMECSKFKSNNDDCITEDSLQYIRIPEVKYELFCRLNRAHGPHCCRRYTTMAIIVMEAISSELADKLTEQSFLSAMFPTGLEITRKHKSCPRNSGAVTHTFGCTVGQLHLVDGGLRCKFKNDQFENNRRWPGGPLNELVEEASKILHDCTPEAYAFMTSCSSVAAQCRVGPNPSVSPFSAVTANLDWHCPMHKDMNNMHSGTSVVASLVPKNNRNGIKRQLHALFGYQPIIRSSFTEKPIADGGTNFGIGLQLPHRSVLIEVYLQCAFHEWHGSTVVQNASRDCPARCAWVLYQHSFLRSPSHGQVS